MSSTITKSVTSDELLAMPDDGYRYELVKGELIQMSPAGDEHGIIAVRITAPLYLHVEEHSLGVVYAAETGFKLESDPDTVRAPDVAFVSRARRTQVGRIEGYWVGAPDLLTEQIKGMTTGEAAAMAQSPETSVRQLLGNVPADRHHCAALACEAVVAAIKSYSDSAREHWEGDEALICTCFCVSERTIEEAIQQQHLRTIAEVTKACRAGAGCRSCYSLIEDILDDSSRARAMNKHG